MINLNEQVQTWLLQDPDQETAKELQTLIDEGNSGELEKRFSGRLQFGTAGLRGPLQAGPMGMNRVLVAQTAFGFARFLAQQFSEPSIVVGYDARKNSYQFAKDTVEIMQAAGVSAHLMSEMCPTPVLAFAVRAMNVSAGVMVTASHNPPQDNGYKVYLGGDDDGAQIIPPNDACIAKEIEWAAEHVLVNEIPRDDSYKIIPQEIIDSFVSRTAAIAKTQPSEIKYVYTAMHGVGKKILFDVLKQANLPLPTLVEQQSEPDGTFPTVAFPNPEEDGALDLAIAKAKDCGAEFIVANDPDADRLAVCVPNEQGEWVNLHGNEMGLYFAWFLAQRAFDDNRKGALACSLVSSPMLEDIATAYGLKYQETLTGFKWIGRIPDLIFGYEEALGYLVNPSECHDKDGISAIVCFLELINSLKSQGKTFAEYRNEFNKKFGVVHSDQISIRVDELSNIQTILTAVRKSPFSEIANVNVKHYIDHLETEKSSNILVFHLDEGHRVIFRPSGTEPKLKIYLDIKGESKQQALELCEKFKTVILQFVSDTVK